MFSIQEKHLKTSGTMLLLYDCQCNYVSNSSISNGNVVIVALQETSTLSDSLPETTNDLLPVKVIFL